MTPIADLQKLKMLVLRDCKSLLVEPGSANDATLRKLIDAGVDVYIKSEHIEAYKKAKATS